MEVFEQELQNTVLTRTMLTKLCFFVGLLCCNISRVDASDILNGFTSKLSKYSVVNPQVIHRLRRSINRPQTEQSFHEGDTVSYALNINDRNHILHLKRNRDFLSPDFLKSLHKASYPINHNHCYYHGKVEGHEDSVVALSTCSGLRGVIILGNDTYGLEPVPETSNHILYLMKDVQSEPSTCGVVDKATSTHNHSHFEPGLSMTSLLRKKRSLPETSYVELVLVADKQRYNFKNQNENAVREEMIELANLLDGYYKPLNIRVVLVGVKIFKTENPFDVEGSAGDVLGRFVKWRKSTLLPEIRNDNAQLVVGRSGAYDGGVLGMAFVGTICSAATSGGINVFNNNALSQFSTVLAHEMGHNLGMSHDGANCACKTASCIMSATASGGMTFSSCSESYFETLVLRGGGLCLKNQPSLSDVVSIPKCGNGLLEKGEECDCGTPEECKNECCHAATCKLTSGAACAHGSCCSNCQLKVPGAPCRSSLDTCDLPEFCDGKGSFCPDDFYMMDGLSCENNAAYCYEGRCQTYNYQCRHLFAPDPAIKAADICFKTANVRGNRFGNCGRRGNNFISCTTDNAMCGKVQCTNVDANTPPNGAQVTIEIIQGETCVNADFHVGTDVLDPAYVNPGSPCAKGKTCLDFACVNASVLLPGLDCNAQTTCHGRGVCNNEGHCHCDNGWGPPFCDRSGFGGSINSGPAQIDLSLRNGLLIFFLLVLPILVLVTLVLLYFFRRDTLDPCLKKRSYKSRSPQNEQPSRNLQQPPQPPAPRSPSPVETKPPIPGFRFGELDYWNDDPSAADPSAATPTPQPPKQGPGVPKPIPPKDRPL